MALADTAELIVKLSLKGNLAQQLKASERAVGSFDAKLSNTQSRAYRAGQQIGTGIKNVGKLAAVGFGIVAANLAAGVNSLIKLQNATLQTEAVLKSTRGVAGQTAASIRKMSNAFETLNATMDDTVIQSGANLLLTFKNIRGKAFEPALKAALDINQALGRGEGGLASTVRALGKALNDPLHGLTALQRLGIVFTNEQKKAIKEALKAGDTLKAQGIILTEIGTRFGGSFEKAGKGIAGQFASVKDAVDDLQRALASALLPALSKIAVAVKTALADPQVVAGIKDIGDSIASLFSDENLKTGADALKSAFQTVKDVLPAIRSGFEITGKVIGTAVSLFKSLPGPLQGLLLTGLAVNKLTGGLVTNIAGGLISAVLKQLVSGVVNVNGAVVNVNGAGIPGGGVPGGKGGGGLLGTIGKAVLPVAIVAVGTEAAIAISGITDSQHKDPSGRTFRGTNEIATQIANLTRAIPVLAERAAAGDKDAVRKLEQVRAEIARLQHPAAKAASAATLAAAEARSSVAHLRDLRHVGLGTRTAVRSVERATMRVGTRVQDVKHAVDRKKLSVHIGATTVNFKVDSTKLAAIVARRNFHSGSRGG